MSDRAVLGYGLEGEGDVGGPDHGQVMSELGDVTDQLEQGLESVCA